MKSEVVFHSLPGLSSFETVWELQKRLVDERIRDEIPDTVLFLEHKPVITRGRGLQLRSRQSDQAEGRDREREQSYEQRNERGSYDRDLQARDLNSPRAMPLLSVPKGVEYFEIERGGDLTYHGPGQLVVYPIVKLSDHDLGGFLRTLENVLIQTLSQVLEPHGHTVRRIQDSTGVWVDDRKIASIGIAVKRWVTFHGLALNLTTDLKAFSMIQPCGFSPEVMTSLEALMGEDLIKFPKIDRQDCESRIAKTFQSLFGFQSVRVLIDELPNVIRNV